KSSTCTELRKGSPKITDYLCKECKSHFEEFLSLLNLLNITYNINPYMVRGLDYYTRTTFEITSEHLGAQKTVAAGGRYDRLVEEFGGPPTPAIGFAIGMERLVEIIKNVNPEFCIPAPKIFIAAIGKKANAEGLLIAEQLRAKYIQAELGYDSASLKSQLRRADKLGSNYVFIIGDDELQSGMIKWKNLKDSSQGEIGIKNATELKGLD
ncbi:MAG: histidine--tRNA ligase, partial [Thermodesulfovibrionales bacterium]|nr:histidine--tRNA ligase [Thermodesulfovibrionales bacterium]